MLQHPIRFALIAVACLATGAVRAALSIYMPPEDLARRAALVVEATVARTASGYDDVAGTLATYVTLDVTTVHRGPAGLERVVVREAGGRFGDLVHEVDAVPVYQEGEQVLAFLEPAADGTLRTSGMFFGKFRLEEGPRAGRRAVRDLEGQGRILGRPLVRDESFALGDLVALTARAAQEDAPRAWRATPPELGRLRWDRGPGPGGPLVSTGSTSGPRVQLAQAGPGPAAGTAFVPQSTSDPARWTESDSGTEVPVNIDPTGNPLGDDAAAVAEIVRAMAAWSDVPESRVVLAPADTAFDRAGAFTASPAAAYSGVNAILFDDPYGDIADPVDCAGVLALGGYWRSTAWTSTVNGVTFHPAVQLYVIFSNDFECFLSDPDNLAEVATHELGHSLGFGHSSEPDAAMRAYAYGFRGARLGDDDRDAAHCHYPHELAVTAPAGGEVYQAGSSRAVSWVSSAEAGPDPGTVSVEYSADGGGSWVPIAIDTPNDGSHTWVLPAIASANARVRVIRHPRGTGQDDTYPEACSAGASGAAFSIVEPEAVPGRSAPSRRTAPDRRR